MTGKYKVFLTDASPDRWTPQPKKSPWSLVVGTCQSLAKDGLDYKVELHLNQVPAHVLITACGRAVTVKKRKKASVVVVMPAKVTPKQVERHLADTGQQLRGLRTQMRDTLTSRAHLRRWRYDHTEDWQVTAARRKVLGKWLGRRLRVNKSMLVTVADYKSLEAVVGHSVRRVSKISATYRPEGIKEYVLKELLGVRGRWPWNGDDKPSAFPFSEFQAAVIDLEYWREMERLTGLNDRFKPGLSDENFYADDEVAC